MNPHLVVKQIGMLLLLLAGLMSVAAVAEFFQFGHPSPTAGAEQAFVDESAVPAFALALVFNFGAGLLMFLVGRQHEDSNFGRRDAMLLVGVAWVIGAATSALPFYLWALMREVPEGVPEHPFQSFAMCYFESVSGLTTTGATILGAFPNDIESLPAGLLLWRSMTQWFGGLGIVVLFVAVLPVVGVGGKKLVSVESSAGGQAVRPRIREAARTLWTIYLGLTLTCAALLFLSGMSLFDAICHTGTTVASGGFSPRNASIGAYYELIGPTRTALIEWIIIFFMTLAGVNFALFYAAANRRWLTLYRDSEFRVYLLMLVSITLTITLIIIDDPIILTTGEELEAGMLTHLRHAAFTVASLQTSTGYASADFDLWPFAAQALLVVCMFAGGCAGSTAGGLKVIRLTTMLKVTWAELERAFRPNVVRPVRVNRQPIEPSAQLAVMVFGVLVVITLVAASIILRVLEPEDHLDIVTTATASIALLMNTGPGFHAVGPTQNFAFFSDPSLYVLSMLMVLGRLEMFALLVLLVPRFWRGN